MPGATVAKDIQRQIERVAAEAADAGAAVDARLPEIDWEGLYGLYGDLLMTVTGVFDPTAQVPEEHRSLAWYLEALDRRDRFVTSWEGFFSDLDALIMPPAVTTAFTHREPGASLNVDGTEIEYGGNGGPLVIFNLTGQPALVVPAGLDQDGLPDRNPDRGTALVGDATPGDRPRPGGGRYPARVQAASRLLTTGQVVSPGSAPCPSRP
jgi:amidase